MRARLFFSANPLVKSEDADDTFVVNNMPGELTELEFSLNDVIDNRPLTPATVDLPTLRVFLEEVEKLIDQADSVRRLLKIANTSQFQHGSENAWVSVEKYLSGKVVKAGGKQDPNVHLVLADSGQSVRISATEQQLGGEKENQLYKDVTLRVQAEQHIRTKALRDVRLIQFIDNATEVDERALENLWQKGREAWRDVTSAAGWVESLRGNK